MRFAFFGEGNLQAWVLRLLKEGHEVAYWVKDDNNRTGEGMYERKKTLDELFAWGDKDPKTIYIADTTNHGKDCDKLRKEGKRVLAGGLFNDKLENDRAFGLEVAKAVGVRIPPFTEVSGIKEAMEHLSDRPEDEAWYFKASETEGHSALTYCGRDIPDLCRHLEHMKQMYGEMPGILQQKIDGQVLNVTSWWTGSKFIGPWSYLIEFKKFLAGNLGPNTGSALNTLWFMDSMPRLAKECHWDRMGPLWEKLAVCPGTFDINMVIPEDGGKPFFLEFGPRFGYDYDLCWLAGLTAPLGETLEAWAAGTLKAIPVNINRIYSGIRLTVEPYPWESIHSSQKSALHSPIGCLPGPDEFSPYSLMRNDDGDFELGDPHGMVGVLIAGKSSLAENKRLMYRNAEKIRVEDPIYRNDYGEEEKEVIRVLKGKRYEVPKGA